jgi:hypothetical protein
MVADIDLKKSSYICIEDTFNANALDEHPAFIASSERANFNK